jgi:hypothetical protein
LPILLTTTIITAAATAFNTAIGTLPWVAEVGKTDRDSGKRPVSRIATILLTFVVDIVIIVGPTLLLEIVVLNKIDLLRGELHFSLSTLQMITIAGLLSVLIVVSGVSYLLGKRALGKLL